MRRKPKVVNEAPRVLRRLAARLEKNPGSVSRRVTTAAERRSRDSGYARRLWTPDEGLRGEGPTRDLQVLRGCDTWHVGGAGEELGDPDRRSCAAAHDCPEAGVEAVVRRCLPAFTDEELRERALILLEYALRVEDVGLSPVVEGHPVTRAVPARADPDERCPRTRPPCAVRVSGGQEALARIRLPASPLATP